MITFFKFSFDYILKSQHLTGFLGNFFKSSLYIFSDKLLFVRNLLEMNLNILYVVELALTWMDFYPV